MPPRTARLTTIQPRWPFWFVSPKAACIVVHLAMNCLLAIGAAAGERLSDFVFERSRPIVEPAALQASPYVYSAQIVDGSAIGGIAINPFVGADRFYSENIFGQGTVAVHIDAEFPFAGPSEHETLLAVNRGDPNLFYSDPTALGATGWHATAASMAIAGGGQDLQSGSVSYVKAGIAPLTTFGAGAMATALYPSGEFETTDRSFFQPYKHFAELTSDRTGAYGFTISNQPTNVINSSWGGGEVTAGASAYSMAIDGLARANPRTTFVFSAGNSGPDNGTVGSPASSYNVISVGSTGNLASITDYSAVVDYSSRGPLAYSDPGRIVESVRHGVDIVAPGTNLFLAYYTGNPAETGYYVQTSGTSFAAPLVSGGVSLLESTSYFVPALAFDDRSRDARLMKAVLLNSADKLAGWDNGQHLDPAGSDTVITTQALDPAQGAGQLNLIRAFDQYLSFVDPDGLGGSVDSTGWSLGSLALAEHRDYIISHPLLAATYLDTTLTWFRDRSNPLLQMVEGGPETLLTTDIGQANFDLQLWDASFTKLYAESESDYDTVEHLHFLLPEDESYGIRVVYDSQTFGTPTPETYGLAWDNNVSAVPEPGTLQFGLAAFLMIAVRRMRGA